MAISCEVEIENLNKGIVHIYEPGLIELVQKNVKAKRLRFTLSYDENIPESDSVFIAVGTPAKEGGEADLSIVLDVIEKIGEKLSGYTAWIFFETKKTKVMARIAHTMYENFLM